MGKQYLTQTKYESEICCSLQYENEIISRIDMVDCYDDEFLVYDVSKYGKAEQLKVYGCWHNPKKPLYIKVTDSLGKVVFDGYGTDH